MTMTTGDILAADTVNAATEKAHTMSDWAIRAGAIATITALPLIGSVLMPEDDDHTNRLQYNTLSSQYSADFSPAIGTFATNHLSVWTVLEPRESTVVFAQSSEDTGLTNIDSPDDVPEGDPGMPEEEIARANGDGVEDSNGIYVEPYNIRPTGDYGTNPNFNDLRTCAIPEAYDSPAIAQKLASFCIKYASSGKGMKVAFMDFSAKSNKSVDKIMNGFEKTLKRVTAGQFKADAHRVAPTKEAKDAFTSFTKQADGSYCTPSTFPGGLMASRMRKLMPEKLGKYSQVMVLTDLSPCISSNLPQDAEGVADEINNADLFSVSDLDNSEVRNNAVHEALHNLGEDHNGAQIPKGTTATKDLKYTYAIPETYYPDNVLDMDEYLGQSEFHAYDDIEANIMGYSGNVTMTSTYLQKFWAGWAKRLMGDNRSLKYVQQITPEGVAVRAKKIPKKAFTVKLLKPYDTGSIDHLEKVIWTDMALMPHTVKERINGKKRAIVDGVSVRMANDRDARSAINGRMALTVGEPSYITFSSTGQKIELLAGLDGSFVMRDVTKK